MTAKMPVRNSIRRSWERSQASLVDSTARAVVRSRSSSRSGTMPGWQQPSPSRAVPTPTSPQSAVAQPSEQAETYAVRALTIAQGLQRRDIEVQALCYLGDPRLARGDPLSEADLRGDHACQLGQPSGTSPLVCAPRPGTPQYRRNSAPICGAPQSRSRRR